MSGFSLDDGFPVYVQMKDTTLPPYKIIFQPSGRGGAAAVGETVLDAARRLGVGIEALCGGKEICGKCQVVVEEGNFSKYDLQSSLKHVSPPGAQESRWLKKNQLSGGARLACSARIQGDLLVTVPAASQQNKQVVYKAASTKVIDLDPIVQLIFLNLHPAGLKDRSDQERILAQLAKDFSLPDVQFDLAALQSLPASLEKGRGELTLTLWNKSCIIRVQPGYDDRPLGLAVDIGSTTLAAYLCNLRTGELLATASGANPQISYGDDIMSRISYAVETPDGLQQLNRCVIKAITTLAKQATAEVGAACADIVDCTLVGNSVMHHLVLNINPAALGRLPFTPSAGGALDVRAADLGLDFNQGARVHVLPLEAGYVGADNVAVILAEAPHLQDEIMLVVDVGTNGELVLGNSQRLVCTSSPTGPAFEGAQITYGMRAAAGAIERVRIDPGTLDVRFKLIGSPLWSDQDQPAHIQARGICGSGILEAVAELFTSGVILSNGRFNKNCPSPRLVRYKDQQAAFILAWGDQSINGEPIMLTQTDIRAVQLAKAALFTGAQFLMKELGVDHVDRIELAGAFGSLLDKQRAMQIGMIPDCDLERVTAVGNAAGDGARIALLNKGQRKEAERIARWVEHVTTPLEGEFQQQFVAALAFPHATLPFPHVEKFIQPAQ